MLTAVIADSGIMVRNTAAKSITTDMQIASLRISSWILHLPNISNITTGYSKADINLKKLKNTVHIPVTERINENIMILIFRAEMCIIPADKSWVIKFISQQINIALSM